MRPGSGKRGEQHRDSVVANYRSQVLKALLPFFNLPRPVPFIAYHAIPPFSAPTAAPTLFGEVFASLTPAGHFETIRTTQSSLSPQLDQSLVNALRQADSAGLLPARLDSGVSQPLHVYLALETSDTTIPHGVPLFTFRTPVWRTMSAARPDSQHPGPAPHFPEQLVSAGYSASLALQVVIDDQGNPVLSTMRIRTAHFQRRGADVDNVSDQDLNDFARAVEESVIKTHYIPASIGGCPIRELAIIPFVFNNLVP